MKPLSNNDENEQIIILSIFFNSQASSARPLMQTSSFRHVPLTGVAVSCNKLLKMRPSLIRYDIRC